MIDKSLRYCIMELWEKLPVGMVFWEAKSWGSKKAFHRDMPYASDCLTMPKGAHSQEEQRVSSSVPLEPAEEEEPSTNQ